MLKERRMTLRLVLLSMCTFVVTNAQAGTDANAMGEQLVNDFVNNVITLKGNFEQSLFDAEGAIVERTSGLLEIERPTRFRWSYAEPYEQWLVADGLNIWNYDIDLEQVTVKPQAEALANTPALLLGGSENALQQFDFGATTVGDITTWVRLEPKDKNSGFNRVDLGFVNEQLSSMVFFDNLEQKTVVALHDVVVNQPIEAQRFEFTVPDDVDVVGVPATAANTDR
jgi:outer membrane lipoprotein carrier protein